MGACFATMGPFPTERNKLFAVHSAARSYALHEYGHGGYTGTIAESTGLTITNKVFKDRDAAESWLEENAEKWGDTLAVRVEPEEGKPFWLFGGEYSE